MPTSLLVFQFSFLSRRRRKRRLRVNFAKARLSRRIFTSSHPRENIFLTDPPFLSSPSRGGENEINFPRSRNNEQFFSFLFLIESRINRHHLLSARYDSSGIEDRSIDGGIVIERLSLLDDDAS